MVTHPIDHVDNDLCVARLKRIDHNGCLPIREDCLDEREELILGNGAADQPPPCLLVGVDGDRWIGKIVHMRCRIKIRQGLGKGRATIVRGCSAGVDIGRYRLRCVFNMSEVVIGGPALWLCWGTRFVSLPAISC